MLFRSAIVLMIAISCLFRQDANGQVLSGVPSPYTMPDGADSVSPLTLSPAFSIPIRNKTGRGIPFLYSLNYNAGNIYQNYEGVFQSTSLLMGWSSPSTTGSNTLTNSLQLYPCWTANVPAEVAVYMNISYQDNYGVSHGFGLTSDNTPNGPAMVIASGNGSSSQGMDFGCGGNQLVDFPVTADDGSGLVLDAQYPSGDMNRLPELIIRTPSGQTIVPALDGTFVYDYPLIDWYGCPDPNDNSIDDCPGAYNVNEVAGMPDFYNGSSSSIQDGNGNTLSYGSGDGTLTDTLGVAALTVNGTVSVNSPSDFGSSQFAIGGVQQFGNMSYLAGDGSTAVYTPSYVQYNVLTSFGCSGVSEYSVANYPLLDHLTLPDGRQYGFTYEPTNAGAATVTGRIATMTMPTGGTISYQYGPMDCTGGNGITSLTRVVNDNNGNIDTWTYAKSPATGGNVVVTITDPASTVTTINYEVAQLSYGATTVTAGNNLATVADSYQGQRLLEVSRTKSVGGTPLTTDVASYISLSGTPGTVPVSSVTLQHQIPNSTGIVSQVVNSYNAIGMMTESDRYDYGVGTPGAILSRTTNSYVTTGSAQNQLSETKTYAGSSASVSSDAIYSYDETTPIATTNTPSHMSGVNGGNLTSIKTLTSGSSRYLTTHISYEDTGNVHTKTDANGTVSTSTNTQCGNSFPSATSVNVGSTILATSNTWDCNGAVVTSSTDFNGNTASMTYADPYWRLTGSKDSLGNTSARGYPGANGNSTTSNVAYADGTPGSGSQTTYDGLGRPILNQQGSSWPSNLLSISTTYDTLGRPTWTSSPYTAPAGSYQSGGQGTTTTYDAMGRPLLSTDAGGGYVQYSYNLNDVLVSNGPAATGENLKQRSMEYNAAGALTSVCEVTSQLSGSSGCGQNTSHMGYLTRYSTTPVSGGSTYQVVQNAQSSGGQQGRVVYFDAAGRKIQEYIPETGNSYFSYDSDLSGRCPGSYPGDLVLGQDNAGNVTCYTYDNLHRMLSSQVVSGPYQNVSPATFMVYDSAALNGTAMQNAKGRLVEAYTCTGSCASKLTDVFVSNAPQLVNGQPTGRMLSQNWEATPNSNGYFSTKSVMRPNGAMHSLSSTLNGNSFGFPHLSYEVDGMGRLSTASAFMTEGGNVIGKASTGTVTFTQTATYDSGENITGLLDYDYIYVYSGPPISDPEQQVIPIKVPVYTSSTPASIANHAAEIIGACGSSTGQLVGAVANGPTLFLMSCAIGGSNTNYQLYNLVSGEASSMFSAAQSGPTLTGGTAPQGGSPSSWVITVGNASNSSGAVILIAGNNWSSPVWVQEWGTADTGATIAAKFASQLGPCGTRPEMLVGAQSASPVSGNQVTIVSCSSGSGTGYQLSVYAFGGGDVIPNAAINTASSGTGDTTMPLVTAIAYNLLNAPTGITYGNGDADTFGYDPTTNRPTSFAYSVNGVSPFYISGGLTWNANSSLQNFSMVDSSDASKNQNCNYQMDDVNRLASVNCAGSWAQNFSYDPFGNITKSGPTSPGVGQITQSYMPGYNSLTNQAIVSASYDANGNQTVAQTDNLSWNAVAQPVSVNGVGAIYDAFGRMVETNNRGSYTQFVFDLTGNKIAVVQNGQLVKGTVPLPGGGTAIYNSNGLSYLRHTDWLGSSRLATTWDHQIYSKEAYAPFGETYNEVGTSDRSFTGQDQDTTSGVFDYLFRKYDPVAGRWLSPDPAGWSSVSEAYPQSLNRYAYVRNDPMRLVDPNGLDCVYFNSDGTMSGTPQAQCNSDTDSGYWINSTGVSQASLDADGNIEFYSANGQLFNGDGSSVVNDQSLTVNETDDGAILQAVTDTLSWVQQNEPSLWLQYTPQDIFTWAAQPGHTPNFYKSGIGGFIYYHGNWCGKGGSGAPIDPTDGACMVHDFLYDKAGLSVGSNFSRDGNPTLKDINQALCNVAAGTGSIAGMFVENYFTIAPMKGAACDR